MGGGGGTPQPVYFGQDPIPVSPFSWLYNRPLPPGGPPGLYPPIGDSPKGSASTMPVSEPQRKKTPLDEVMGSLHGQALGGGGIER